MCAPGLPHAHWSLIVLILFFGGLVSGSAVNRTIDDVFGDRVTGDLVQYLPEVPASEGPLWFNQTSCSGCAGVPDASLTLDNTWSAARYLADIGSMSLSMKFSGTAIYVFFVIPNFAAGTGLASAVLCDFFIDGAAVGSFSHESDGSGAFIYNTLVYRNTSIPAGDHVLLIETTGASPAVIIFDYALYTDNVPDNAPDDPDPSPSQHSTVSISSSSPAELPSSTAIAPHEDTSSPTSLSPSPTPTSAAPAFPTSAEATTISLFSTSIIPFLLTVLPSDSNSAPLSTTLPSVTADASNEGASRRSISVIAIIGAVVGAVVLIILVLLFLMLCRRRRLRRAQEAATGTISTFDLLNGSPSPPLSLQPSLQPSSQPPRPLPAPPMLQNPGGRSVGATQTKTETPVQMPVAGPSGFNFRAEDTFARPSRYHSAQSSVSVSNYSSDSCSDLRIDIPMTSFRPAYSPHSPATYTPSRSHTPSNSHDHSLAHSHDHSASYGHGHSPITRNGVPMQPAQADIVRDLILGALTVDHHEASLRRGSEDSGYTPTAEGREVGIDDDGIWDELEPVVHVDSGIRISRTVIELPPAYAAR